MWKTFLLSTEKRGGSGGMRISTGFLSAYNQVFNRFMTEKSINLLNLQSVTVFVDNRR